jgi:hypothetical protein|tara:strand:- start:667 stop:1050 length:384 start_codon:yes stop_codon:yes gene_type:complete
MKYFNWIFIFSVMLLLITNYAFADSNKSIFNLYTKKIPYNVKVPINSVISCGSTETFMDTLIAPFKEKSVFGGISLANKETIIYEIYYNNDSQSFTIAQHFAIGNTCVLGAGEVIRMNPPFNKTKYN